MLRFYPDGGTPPDPPNGTDGDAFTTNGNSAILEWKNASVGSAAHLILLEGDATVDLYVEPDKVLHSGTFVKMRDAQVDATDSHRIVFPPSGRVRVVVSSYSSGNVRVVLRPM